MTWSRSLRWKLRKSWRCSENDKPAIDKVPEIESNRCRVLGLALRHDCKNIMQIRLEMTPKRFSDCDNRGYSKVSTVRFLAWPRAMSDKNDGSHVRAAGQTPYPSQLHGASLATAMQRPCRLLPRYKHDKKKEVLHPFRWYTHTETMHCRWRNLLWET